MHRPKLIKRKAYWYLIDDSVALSEGCAAMYDDTIPVFTNFIDEELKLCTIGIVDEQVPLEQLVAIMGSSNPNDGIPMLNMDQIYDKYLTRYVFTTLSDKFGVKYPDEHDSVMDYYETELEAIKAVRDYIEKKFFNILTKDVYDTDYTIGFKEGKQIAYPINGCVNILSVKTIKKSN